MKKSRICYLHYSFSMEAVSC